jgi:hypothetical protein
MELAGKESFGRPEIAQGQDKADRIGGSPGGRQHTLQTLGEGKEPLAFYAAEERWSLEGGIFRWGEDGYPWHQIPPAHAGKKEPFQRHNSLKKGIDIYMVLMPG